jgi:CBS domain-containing protein
MSRREVHLDAMLRHLGATYYQTLYGQATAADVAKAVESVTAEEGPDGTGKRAGADRQAAAGAAAQASACTPQRSARTGRWRVHDVMIADVVTARKEDTYKRVVSLMSEHRVGEIPVLGKDRHVVGIVSEADLIRKQERRYRRMGTGLPGRTRHERAQAEGRSVAELMTSPAITIHPDAPIGAAARLMNGRHIKLLPVVDPAGQLIGIVTRGHLLSVFLRPDSEIADEVRGVLRSVLLADADGVTVTAHDAAISLSGALPPDLIAAAVRLAGDVDGVVTVVNKLTGSSARTGVTPGSGVTPG